MQPTSSYTPYYCEENVYKLCEALLRQHKNDLYVIFISNRQKQVQTAHPATPILLLHSVQAPSNGSNPEV